MAYLNENYLKLQAGYLFPEIARHVRYRGLLVQIDCFRNRAIGVPLEGGLPLLHVHVLILARSGRPDAVAGRLSLR